MFWGFGFLSLVLAAALSAIDTHPQYYGIDNANGALVKQTDALSDCEFVGECINNSELVRIREETTDFNNGNTLDKRRGCSPTISCTMLDGYCVKSGADCNGTVDRYGCRGGKKCRCCIPDKTTPTPPTCPPVTPSPTTTGPSVRPNTTWHHVGEDSFVRFPDYMNWFEAEALCQQYWLNLYHPADILAVAAYLEANYSERYYWLGGRGDGTNQVWLDGEGLTSTDPWYRPETYYRNGTDWCLNILTFSGWPQKGTVLFTSNCTYPANTGDSTAVLCG